MFLILLSLSQHKASLATSSGSSNGEDCHQNNTVTGNLKYGPINLKNKTWNQIYFHPKIAEEVTTILKATLQMFTGIYSVDE